MVLILLLIRDLGVVNRVQSTGILNDLQAITASNRSMTETRPRTMLADIRRPKRRPSTCCAASEMRPLPLGWKIAVNLRANELETTTRLLS